MVYRAALFILCFLTPAFRIRGKKLIDIGETAENMSSSMAGANVDVLAVQNTLTDLHNIADSLKDYAILNARMVASLKANSTNKLINGKHRDDPTKRSYRFTAGIGWHKLYTSARTWFDAVKACREDGANLVVVNSEQEARVLGSMLEDKLPLISGFHKGAFIGIHDQFKEGEWVTIFNEPLAEAGYNHWGVGLPDNTGISGGKYSANCGIINKNGTFIDLYCNNERSYFCEIPLRPAC